MNGKNYTVMELAEQVGVPRTTINDWLGRYSQYIDTVAQGKRKVYPESALNVLREIAALRNAGKAFTEIETELSAKHPIRAVPVPPQEEPAEPKKPAASQSPEKEPQPAAGEGFALIARQQSEEIGKLIGESFRNMDDRIRELESISASQRRMSYFWLAACILFLLILAGGVALISVGAAPEVEMKEAQMRIEDALAATRAAVEEGIVAGGGVALLNVAKQVEALKAKTAGDEKTGVDIVLRTLEAPMRQIAKNAGEEGSVIVENIKRSKKLGYGFDAADNSYGDMLQKGIIDPTKVTRCALQNAASVAAMVLTTESLVCDIPKPEPAAPAPGMGGDMY